MSKRFKLVRVMLGSGWPSGHIAVDEHYSWPEKPGGGELCLNLDTCSSQELSDEIDELIAELEEIRRAAPARFEQWDREYRESRKRLDK